MSEIDKIKTYELCMVDTEGMAYILNKMIDQINSEIKEVRLENAERDKRCRNCRSFKP